MTFIEVQVHITIILGIKNIIKLGLVKKNVPFADACFETRDWSTYSKKKKK